MEAALQSRLSALKAGIQKVQTYRNIIRAQTESDEAKSKSLKYKADLYQRCAEVFKKWLEDSLQNNVGSMADLTTSALRHIIHNQDLSFHIRQDPRLSRLNMKFTVEEDGNEGDPIDNHGGGAAMIASLILRLSVMTRLRMANLLVLDEPLSGLSKIYLPAAGAFIRRLAEETGVNILMVTHTEEFLEQAHVAYEGRKEDGRLQLRKRSVR